MASHLLDEIQNGPAYAEGNGAPLSILITGVLLAALGVLVRLTSRSN